MFLDKQHLRIPGPVPVPTNVLSATAKPMINHRGDQFKELMPSILQRLKFVFQTENPVLAITGSGTAAMEAAVANLVNPDDPVLVLIGGSFGQRWANICQQYRAKVYELEYTWGEGIDPDKVNDFLTKHPEIEVVFATHNESSTAVLNDVEAIGEVIAKFNALFVVDAVSSLGGSDLKTDAWNIDVVCAASQKCLMMPPGLSFISLSQRAQIRMEAIESPRFYFDLRAYLEMLAKGEPPYTPNISGFFALEQALDLIEAEGLEQMFTRHCLMRDMLRAGLSRIELPLLVADKWASPTVTAVKPEILDVPYFIKKVRDDYGVELAGGQDKFSNKIFRIGHMGYATPLDMITTLVAIESALGKHGEAVAAAEQLWHSRSNNYEQGGE